jgi:cytochrome c peroxidase
MERHLSRHGFIYLTGLMILITALVSSALDWWAFRSDLKLTATFPASPAPEDFADLRRAYGRKIDEWPRPVLSDGVTFQEFSPLEISPRPTGREAQKARLGARLFRDPQLSGSGQIACESCHNPQLGFGDGLMRAVGHDRQTSRRNSPSIFSSAYRPSQFWDGRAKTLEDQIAGPLLNPIEMANPDIVSVVSRIRSNPSYVVAFRQVYGETNITYSLMTDSIAAFEKQLERPTGFDRFLTGESPAPSDEFLWGLNLFRGKAGCANCHSGPLLTDEKMHNLGLTFAGRQLQDFGLYEISGIVADAGLFRTPSLRHLNQTGPYMHNGVFRSLSSVVQFYNIGGGSTAVPEGASDAHRQAAIKSPLIKPLGLTPPEINALKVFLESL